MGNQPILTDTITAFGEMECYAVLNNGYHEHGTSIAHGAHVHGCHEIYLNVSGDVSFFHENIVYDIEPYDMIVSYPGDVHYCIFHSSCTHGHYCLWLKNDLVGNFLERRRIRGHIRLSPADKEHLPKLLQRITDRGADPFLRAAAMMELLCMPDIGEDECKNELPSPVDLMLEYIDQHLTTVSGSAELAQAFFVSTATVNRTFRKHVGLSAAKLIEAKRLSYAEQLLRRDASVTDACYQSGFSDCSRFIAAFRRKFGQTPLKYKKDLFDKK